MIIEVKNIPRVPMDCDIVPLKLYKQYLGEWRSFNSMNAIYNDDKVIKKQDLRNKVYYNLDFKKSFIYDKMSKNTNTYDTLFKTTSDFERDIKKTYIV